jgi:hypothetical protein
LRLAWQLVGRPCATAFSGVTRSISARASIQRPNGIGGLSLPWYYHFLPYYTVTDIGYHKVSRLKFMLSMKFLSHERKMILRGQAIGRRATDFTGFTFCETYKICGNNGDGLCRPTGRICLRILPNRLAALDECRDSFVAIVAGKDFSDILPLNFCQRFFQRRNQA